MKAFILFLSLLGLITNEVVISRNSKVQEMID